MSFRNSGKHTVSDTLLYVRGICGMAFLFGNVVFRKIYRVRALFNRSKKRFLYRLLFRFRIFT